MKDRLIDYKRCNSPLSNFYMITVDGERIGSLVTKQEAKLLIKWLDEIMSEIKDEM